MGKSKKKKKKSSSKSQYDAKKKNISTSAKASEKSAEKEKEKTEDISAIAEKEFVEAAETAADPTPKAEEIKTEDPSPAEPIMPAAPMVDIPYDPNFTEEDFMLSVSDLKAEDINVQKDEKEESAQENKKKRSKTSNIIQIALIALFAGVAIVCLVMLGENVWGKIKGQALYSSTQFEGFTLDGIDESEMRNLAYMGSDAPMLTLFERINAGKSSANEVTGGQYDQQLADMKIDLIEAYYDKL